MSTVPLRSLPADDVVVDRIDRGNVVASAVLFGSLLVAGVALTGMWLAAPSEPAPPPIPVAVGGMGWVGMCAWLWAEATATIELSASVIRRRVGRFVFRSVPLDSRTRCVYFDPNRTLGGVGGPPGVRLRGHRPW